MLYEDGPDLEQCQSFPTPVDPNEKFYDDLLNSPTLQTEDPRKRAQISLGLPTPPTTPERIHCHLRLRNPKGLEQTIMNLNSYSTNPYCDTRLQSPNSNNLQVVPESIPEQAVQEILPFLEDLESRSMSSPNFYGETVGNQQCLSPPSSLVAESYSQAPGSYQQTDQTIALGSFSDSPEHTPFQQTQLYNDCQNETGPFTTYSGGFTSSHCATVPASMSNLASKESIIPSCIMSPVSPNTHMDRAYYPASITAVQTTRGIGPSKRVARELSFAPDFSSVISNGTQASMLTRPSQELLCQIGGMENYPNQDGENGETELSRATHNVLERQRRNDLKMRFHMLRDNIPELMNNEKAPKIQILKKAHEYTDELSAQEQRLLADKELERQRKLILLRRLSLLRQGFFL